MDKALHYNKHLESDFKKDLHVSLVQLPQKKKPIHYAVTLQNILLKYLTIRQQKTATY